MRDDLLRALFASLGLLFFALGIIGVVLPGLPTTPFMLLALWAFSRSSGRLHDWLYNHSMFGASLQQWQQYRVIPRKAKIVAVLTMFASLSYLFLFTAVALWFKGVTALFILIGAAFILSRPSRIPPPAE